MIFIKLHGGLGNQLFQYATGKALSATTGKHMLFDLYYLYGTNLSIKNETPRTFELSPYHLNVQITSPSNRSRIFPPKLAKYWYTTLYYKKYNNHITENNFSEAPTIPGNLLLDGYFQDERYFISIREQLLREIRLPVLPQAYGIFSKNIEVSNSVGVHIRRGDYISNAAASMFHGSLPVSYYREAFEIVNKRSGNCSFFFFSDDIAWVKQQFADMPGATFVEAPQPSLHAELELMKQCKHQVIANSSFSWWGAWLNDHPGKIVVAPKQWFVGTEKNASFSLPIEWARI